MNTPSSTNDEFNHNNFPHSADVMRILDETFHYNKFHNIQLPVINAAILGKDCFVIMPTGGFKSLCYQLPALLSNGITVVITPLKSIIYNQLYKLRSLNIKAEHFSGDQTEEEQFHIQSTLEKGNIKILYVTPDKAKWSRVVVPYLKELLEKGLISRFIIDEAHCLAVSHKFRPTYNLVLEVKDLFRNVQVMTFTATATPSVQMEIKEQLEFKDFKHFVADINRPNLKYSVVKAYGPESKCDRILSFINSHPKNESGIIYCFTQEDCHYVADYLHSNKVIACAYHADIEECDKQDIEHLWQTNQIQVICATFAFGMGVDKPNVRFVLHYSMPKSLEHYVQETGRAGHDGQLAECILYFNRNEYFNYRRFPGAHNDDLLYMFKYCQNDFTCRRSQLCKHFDQHFNREDCLKFKETACDSCKKTLFWKPKRIHKE